MNFYLYNDKKFSKYIKKRIKKKTPQKVFFRLTFEEPYIQ